MTRRAWIGALVVLAVACGAPPVTPGSDGGAVCAIDRDCDDGLFCTGIEHCRIGDPLADAFGCVADARPCTGMCSETTDRCVDACPDADHDGASEMSCGGTDCDDTDANRFPHNTEVCDATHDEDCDPTTVGDRDVDGDGYQDAMCCNGATCGTDCDDTNAAVHPTEAETCDHLDNDCDTAVDEMVLHTYYVDADDDRHGVAGTETTGCIPATGYAEVAGDCDDTNPTRYDGAVEACDGVDNDCDTTIDEDGSATWYADADSDGYGTSIAPMMGCARPTGYAPVSGDCDDTRASVFPGATEICNGRDDDCNGLLDGPNEDVDRDGVASLACTGTDCDDTNASRYPGAPDICDGLDDDCSAATMPSDDRDGDGHLPVGATCAGGPLGSAPRDDCDETNPARYGGQLESCNGVDDDCDAIVDGAPATAWCNAPGRSPNATATCSAAICVLACTMPYLDCSAGPGCETDGHQPATCGACTNACGVGAICPAGQCTPRIASITTITATVDITGAAVQVGATGVCHVGGSFHGRLDVAGTSVTALGGSDAFHVALDSTGALVFARSSATSLDDEGHALALASSGDIALGGSLGSSAPAGSSGLLESRSTAGTSRFRASVGAGTATHFDFIAPTPSGGFVAAGVFRGPITIGTTSYPGSASADTGLVVAISSAGSVLWSRTIGVADATWGGGVIGVGVDALGNVFSGFWNGTMPTSTISLDGNTGATRWSHVEPADASDEFDPRSLVVRPSGPCVAGPAYGTIIVGGTAIAIPGMYAQVVVACYDANGTHLAHRVLPYDQALTTFAVSGETLLLGGYLYMDTDFGTGLLHDAFLVRLHADLSVDWTWQPSTTLVAASIGPTSACYVTSDSTGLTVVSLAE